MGSSNPWVYNGGDTLGPFFNYTDYSGDLTLSGKITPSVSDNISVSENISVSLGDGDVETRPLNFTERYWKRIS